MKRTFDRLALAALLSGASTILMVAELMVLCPTLFILPLNIFVNLLKARKILLTALTWMAGRWTLYAHAVVDLLATVLMDTTAAVVLVP